MSYEDFALTFSRSRIDHPWKEIEKIIHMLREENMESILDVGCGNGRFLEEASRFHFSPVKYRGIDSSMKMIEEARRLHPDFDFDVMPMENLEQIQDSFSVLIFIASFHHLENREVREVVLQQAFHLLPPGGKILMTNWNLRDQPKYEKSHVGNGDFQIKIGTYSRFYHGFTLEELGILLENTGFTLLENEIFPGGRNIFSVAEKRM